MTDNPLKNYLRKPEIYIKLPSNGKWWPEGSIEIPTNGELPIMAMTGHDDLIMKNADGLMNGSTSVEVIQSCVPNIKNAWAGPNVDIEYLFIAIRIASYGNELDVEKSCGKCNETTKFGINLHGVLESLQVPDFNTTVQVGDLHFMLKPSTYEMANLSAQKLYEQQRAILAAQSPDLTVESREKILRDTIQKLGEISTNQMIEYIEYVMLPDGSKVTDREHIIEFINQSSRRDFDTLKKGIDDKNAQYNTPDIPFVCSACGNEETTKFEFNPSNFFAADS